jgi:surfactin synthase thioesterase subunit
MLVAPDPAAWFLTSPSDPVREARVYCFPHAGGNPRTFLDWRPGLGDEADIVPVCLPGRGRRSREPAPASVAELADGAAAAIRAHADRPFHLFGHSLGAVVAFEVARRLAGHRHLRHLIASGCAAPSLLPSRRIVETARLRGKAFTQAVGFFGGLPPAVVEDEDLADLLLPGLRADFQLVAGYRYRSAASLAIPVTLVNGEEDPHVKDAGLEPWQQECAIAPACRWVSGGHFYFDGRPDVITDILRTVVRAGRGVPGHGDEHVEVI